MNFLKRPLNFLIQIHVSEGGLGFHGFVCLFCFRFQFFLSGVGLSGFLATES